MPAAMTLIIRADQARQTVQFRLTDGHGNQLAFHSVALASFSVSEQRGMFDLGQFLAHYVAPDEEATVIEATAVCIAKKLLGEQIFMLLWNSTTARTLSIVLPPPSFDGAGQNLVADLARVPWEIAKPQPGAASLAEKNVLIRLQHEAPASIAAPPQPQAWPLPLAQGEALRVLFVFAQAKGAQPLGMRRERREMMHLFQQEIYPKRRVIADCLTHGVTRARLQAQIAENGGYHIIHWSGHGGPDVLELASASGEAEHISGTQLLELLNQAGGFLPHLFFLSACNSGAIGKIENWQQFAAAASAASSHGSAPPKPVPADNEIAVPRSPGFTGTAHALLQAGVPAVVAMRYAVGDDYARELAQAFYRALLAHEKPKDAATALNLARRALQAAAQQAQPEPIAAALFSAVDAATPVLFGGELPAFLLEEEPSPAVNLRNPRLHQISELTVSQHPHFVGRTWELAALGTRFFGSSFDAHSKPVALIKGLGGMGKSALCAEVLDLWQAGFDWVLLYQAKPHALALEAVLRDIHARLKGELQMYHQHVQRYPADAIYRDADDEFTGTARLQRLMQNLSRAMQAEKILLVLDNFEANLMPDPQDGVLHQYPQWQCQDPAWDECLALLARELGCDACGGGSSSGVDNGSRVLLTCRRPLAALDESRCHTVALGPLNAAEAVLYLSEHPVLEAMAFGENEEDWDIAQRLLVASRFHPLLMDRLARLAAAPQLRAQLLQALETLEQSSNFSQLPALFTAVAGAATEMAYLEDALAISLDQLIAQSSADARRVLWLVAVANEPMALNMLSAVWRGDESAERQSMRRFREKLNMLPQLPPERRAELENLPPERRAQLLALPPQAGSNVQLAPLLHHLAHVGLITAPQSVLDDDNPVISCHELVRERIIVWMAQHEGDKANWSENAIRLAYVDLVAENFDVMLVKDRRAALAAGSRAIVYCVQAEDYLMLANFANVVINGSNEPGLLQSLLPYLQSAADVAPAGPARWSCLCVLADALRKGCQPDASLPFYQQAAAQARAAAQAGGDGTRQAWSDLGWISCKVAIACGDVGKLEAARQHYQDSAAAYKQAGHPTIRITAMELGALRIDIKAGKVEQALPQIEARLAQMAAWRQRWHEGKPVPEAPDREGLASSYATALDIGMNADVVLKDWQSALRRIDVLLEVLHELKLPPEEIAADRMNRTNVLRALGRFDEARSELEACLRLFQHMPAGKASVLGSLASLFASQNDIVQATDQQRRALALHENLPSPADRANSHSNLAVYLDRNGAMPALEEARWHHLAALAYRLASGLDQACQDSWQNYTNYFRRAASIATVPFSPRLCELLARSEFTPLRHWLRQREIVTADLQTAIDDFLAQARQHALDDSESDYAPGPPGLMKRLGGWLLKVVKGR